MRYLEAMVQSDVIFGCEERLARRFESGAWWMIRRGATSPDLLELRWQTREEVSKLFRERL